MSVLIWKNHAWHETTERGAAEYQESGARGQKEKNDSPSSESHAHGAGKTGGKGRKKKTQNIAVTGRFIRYLPSTIGFSSRAFLAANPD